MKGVKLSQQKLDNIREALSLAQVQERMGTAHMHAHLCPKTEVMEELLDHIEVLSGRRFPITSKDTCKAAFEKLEEYEKALQVARHALKFYAGQARDAVWHDNKFIASDKFGGLCEEISGPRVAQITLLEIKQILDEK